MSSITKAAARPVSTIRNASAWSLAARMFMPRFCCALISVICLMLVVPEVETMVLPLRSSSCLQVGRLLRHEAVGGDEMGDRERDLLLSLEVVGGRAALEVDGAVGDQRDAVGRGDRVELDLELWQLELLLHAHRRCARRDPSHSRLPAAYRRSTKTAPRIAVAERDRARILDLLQRAGGLLGESWTGGEDRSRDHESSILRCIGGPSW